jgi:tetratricopeptide (TPR) repeat protein
VAKVQPIRIVVHGSPVTIVRCIAFIAGCLIGSTPAICSAGQDSMLRGATVCSSVVPDGDKDPADLDDKARLKQESGTKKYMSGFQNRNKSEVEAAVAELEAGLKIDPRMPNVYGLLSAYYVFGKQDARMAVDVLTDGLKHNPKSPSVHFSLGNTLSAMKKPKEAISHFQAALDLGFSCKGVAYFNIGNAYLDQRDWRPAIEYYEKALKADPDYVKAQKNLVLAFYHSGNKSKAKAAASRLVEMDPDGETGAWAREALKRLQ